MGCILVFDLRPSENDPATLRRAAEQLSHSPHHAALCLHDDRGTLLSGLITALTGGSFRSPLLDALLPLAVHPGPQRVTGDDPEESLIRPNQDCLSDRERQVVELCVTGLTNLEIAEQLFVSVSTVKTHLRRAFAKLGVHRREDLVDQL